MSTLDAFNQSLLAAKMDALQTLVRLMAETAARPLTSSSLPASVRELRLLATAILRAPLLAPPKQPRSQSAPAPTHLAKTPHPDSPTTPIPAPPSNNHHNDPQQITQPDTPSCSPRPCLRVEHPPFSMPSGDFPPSPRPPPILESS